MLNYIRNNLLINMRKALWNAWYRDDISWWLLPFIVLEEIYKWMVYIRYRYYAVLTKPSIDVPIVVVGGITLGGSGKTPAVITLTHILMSKGLRVGLISRGYKGMSSRKGMRVLAKSGFNFCGDEAVLLAKKTKCPVYICKKRNKAIRTLIQEQSVDVIISDDGLQHYALPRQVEIAVIDAKKGIGNGRCLPVGPLREPVERLDRVDFLLINQINGISHQENSPKAKITHEYLFCMKLQQMKMVNLRTGEQLSTNEWRQKYHDTEVHAVAGIAHPHSFLIFFGGKILMLLHMPFPIIMRLREKNLFLEIQFQY